jgi:hypothetical protein
MTLEEAVQQIYTVLEERNKSYGDENLKDYGVLGLLIRMSDKLARIRNALTLEDKERAKEVIKDALVDIAGYAINGLRIVDDYMMGRYLDGYRLTKD